QVTVQIYAGATAKGAVVATATATGIGGAFVTGDETRALSICQYTAVATQESSLGNPSGVSEPRTFTVDTTSPTVTLDPVKSPSKIGRASCRERVRATTPVPVQIKAGATAEGSVVTTATASSTG